MSQQCRRGSAPSPCSRSRPSLSIHRDKFIGAHLSYCLFSPISQSAPSSPSPTRDASPSTPTPKVRDRLLCVVSGGDSDGARSPTKDLASTLGPTCGFHPLIGAYFPVRETVNRAAVPDPSGTTVVVDGGYAARGKKGVRSSGVCVWRWFEGGADLVVLHDLRVAASINQR